MDEQHTASEQPAPREWPVGLIVGFSAVFVVGFALIAAVLMARQRKSTASTRPDSGGSHPS